jgi:hypothetical protein
VGGGAERAALGALLSVVEAPTEAAPLPDDDALLLAVARRHRLTPLLATLAGASLPRALAAACRQDRLAQTARNLMFREVAAEATRALAADGVDTIVLKGIAYEATLYANGCRPTSDVDLLVPSARRRQAFAVLDRLGFEPRAAAPGFDDADYHEVAWTRGGVELDLHLGLAPSARCAIDEAAVWAAREPLELPGVRAARLGAAHAAAFHALHMAIDHFDVPALYLVDLSRLLPDEATAERAEEAARAWRTARPFETAVALAAALLPRWARALRARPVPERARAVVERYGPLAPVPRPEQLRRKVAHFDSALDASRYLAVQARRNLRELWERRARGRTARARLGLPPRRSG